MPCLPFDRQMPVNASLYRHCHDTLGGEEGGRGPSYSYLYKFLYEVPVQVVVQVLASVLRRLLDSCPHVSAADGAEAP